MKDRQIFLNAPADAAPGIMSAYLDRACGDDEDLRARVEALIAADQDAGSFLEQPALDADATILDGARLAEGPGDVIGNFKLLQKIGEGGFGVVYMADQLHPVKRRVAFKIIKLGMDTHQVVARFEAERQALAMMDHPNIAKVLDAGATDSGRPYFVMELIRGIPITQFCDENNLTTRERLELFIDVCQAVQHAHQKGIIHRDLKPSNVMVTMHDDKPVPKVIDFGVAKATQADLTDKTLYTRYEQFIGTPAYMSPEQAQMSGLDIDTRSDIYALGVLLYELLTGKTPFDSKALLEAGQDEIRRVIREDEPPKPSTRLNTLEAAELTELAKRRKSAPERLHSLLRGDLDWIIMMALEKDRTRRYETANGLALDLRRHLANEPVAAAAPGPFYRMGKYVRRHRRSVTSALAMVLVLSTAATVIILQAIDRKRTRDALATAEREREVLEMEKQSAALRKEQRALTRDAVGLGEWEVARRYVSEFLKYPKEGRASEAPRLDRFKLAILHLVMGDRQAYQEMCEEMIGKIDRSQPGPEAEAAVRAYFAVSRSPGEPLARETHKIADRVRMLKGYEAWEHLARGMADFRMGNHEEARRALSSAITTPNPLLQPTVRAYLAMTCHHLGDDAGARRYLGGAEESITRLEAQDPNQFWHERLIGHLAYEEARALINGDE